ncbi:MAG: cation:proton antiporter [Muribaculaceae bacterium]|nr:cation:proton antiporter [Muribaculaceae bacterium]MDE6485993.1 cation:proton antiporter [Muribaculaceae bacterium]
MPFSPLITQPVAIFSVVLMIILFAPLLLSRLKVPHIVGMIVAGVVVGPYGFNVLDNDSSFAIFGQVGLLYLMFLAGLEIDMYHLRLNLRRGMLFGVMTLVIPLVLGVLSSVFLLRLGWTTSLLLGAMYASHTLISYPVAARFGITKSAPVLVAIVGTIIAVAGALFVLAAVGSVARDGQFSLLAMLWLLVKMMLWTMAMLYSIPRLTRWFFKRYGEKVTQYVFVMVMVFMAAWSAQLIGLEAVLGAFAAGLVLNRYVPAASPLMSSIEFVGNALFIPYFLISVGMMINVRVIFNADTLAVSAVMLAVAIVGKWLPAFLAQRVNGYRTSGRDVMFGLTCAHTAVALAVVTVGYDLGLLDVRVLNSTVLVILVTCAIAPMITARAAAKEKIAMLEDEDGDDRPLRHNRTLVPVANPLTAPSLVEMAVLMRNDRGTHDFYALHVRADNAPQAKRVSAYALDAATKAGSAVDVEVQPLERYDLNAITGMVNVIEERDITEVILGMHRRVGVIDSFFGSKVDQLLRATNRMVIIPRCYIPPNTLTRIVVRVPAGAQYETGFSRWVRCLARLTHQLGCRIIFCCPAAVQPLIRGVLYQANYGVRCEFRTAETWDDFIPMAGRVLDDDLFVVIGARANSVSHDSDMVHLPEFLQRYFSGNNLMIIYPEQFGETPALTSFVDPHASDAGSAPSPIPGRLRRILLHLLGKK